LVPTSIILNGVIALILVFSLNLIAVLANYVTVSEDRPIISVKYCLTVPVQHAFVTDLTVLPAHPTYIRLQNEAYCNLGAQW